MKASAHKTIVMAGCGCGALLGVVALVAIVFAYLQDPDFLQREFAAAATPSFSPAQARDALDSLRRLDFIVLARPPARDRYTLPVRGDANGAETAVATWTRAIARSPIAFGDTFPDGTRLRSRWADAHDWEAVDSLRAAALRPWDLAAALPDDEGMPYVATEVLSTLRAVLARARVAEVKGDRAEADTLARAVVTIGRRLRADGRLYHVVLGARAEVEALHVLAAPAAARARAESVSTAAEQAYRLVTMTGALAENSEALAGIANDASVALPVRRAALIAIGSGWAFAPGEQGAVDAGRGKVLSEFLEDAASPPPALRQAAVEARRLATLSLFSRVEAMARVQRSWTAWLRAG